MSKPHEQRIHDELIFQAGEAAKERAELAPTPAAKVEQYRDCADWRTRRVECLIRYLTLHHPKRVCDFGCGSGVMSTRLGLLGYQVEGFDVSPDVLEVARQRAVLDGVEDRVKFTVADGATDSLPKGQFDAVLAMSVLHHLPLEEGLRAMNDLLAPGGYIAFQEPVAYSSTLQWFRDRTPVKKDVSPDERQLSWAEIQRIGEVFQIEAIRHYELLHRFHRLVPDSLGGLFSEVVTRLDQLLLMIPGMRHFAGIVIILARKRD